MIRKVGYAVLATVALFHSERGALGADAEMCSTTTAPDQAIRACSSALGSARTQSDLATIYYIRGHAYWRNKNFPKAVDDLTAAIRIQPDAKTFASRGLIYESMNDTTKARTDFQTALNYQPGRRPDDQWARNTARERLSVLPEKLDGPATVSTNPQPSSPATIDVGSSPASTSTDRFQACAPKNITVSATSTPETAQSVSLDKCFKGRAHMTCIAKALREEATALQAEYADILAVDYPARKDIKAVCAITSAQLSQHQSKAKNLAERSKTIKQTYADLATCVERLDNNLGRVSVASLQQGSDILRSLREELKADVATASAAEQSIIKLSGSIETSAKAMAAVGAFHRASLCN